jgi:hypothetical protein
VENSYSYSDSEDYGDEEASYQRRQQEAINELSSESSISNGDFEMLNSDRFYEHMAQALNSAPGAIGGMQLPLSLK